VVEDGGLDARLLGRPEGKVVDAPVADSVSLDSGVVCRELCVLKLGRSKLVKEGEGGSGVGGRL
jgi:hypothetical protein